MDSRRLDERLKPALEEAEIADVWRRVRDAQADERRGARRGRVMVMAAGGGALMVAAAVMVVLWVWPGGGSAGGNRRGGAGAGPVASAATALDPGVRVAAVAERALPMNDGSVVTLAAAAELEVLANEGDKFVTAVRRGHAHFDVKTGGPRRWVVETDLATVEVVGTAFSVERSEERLAVVVERGVVLVRGERVPGRVVRLTAGERLEIPAEPVAAVKTAALAPGAAMPVVPPVAPVTPTASGAAEPRDRAPGPSPEAEPRNRAPKPSPDPGTATGAGAASASASTAGAGITAPPAPPSAPAVIQSADRLLAAGQPAEAAAILDAYLDDAPADASAGLAAFLLGRIAQDSLHDPDRAAAAFARTLQIGSPRAVQEEALARRARALDRAGRPAEPAR